MMYRLYFFHYFVPAILVCLLVFDQLFALFLFQFSQLLLSLIFRYLREIAITATPAKISNTIIVITNAINVIPLLEFFIFSITFIHSYLLFLLFLFFPILFLFYFNINISQLQELSQDIVRKNIMFLTAF